MAITGGCLCGEVRYRFETEAPLAVRQCWCRVCQYFASGSATTNALFRSADLTVTGEMRDFASVADSGSLMHRRFCPACGVHLFSEAESRPQFVFVRAGTLDDPNLAAPQAVIWTASAPRWACFDPNLPQTVGQPAAPTAKG